MRIPTTAPCLTARYANECTVASPSLPSGSVWLSTLRRDTAPVASCCCYSPQTSRQTLRVCIGGLCAPPTEYDRCRDSAAGRTGSRRTIPASLACCIVHRAGCRLQRRCCSIALFVPHCRAERRSRMPLGCPPACRHANAHSTLTCRCSPAGSQHRSQGRASARRARRSRGGEAEVAAAAEQGRCGRARAPWLSDCSSTRSTR